MFLLSITGINAGPATDAGRSSMFVGKSSRLKSSKSIYALPSASTLRILLTKSILTDLPS